MAAPGGASDHGCEPEQAVLEAARDDPRAFDHYAADGRLIERARLPEMYSKLLTGPDGKFYVLKENPIWTQRGGGHA